MRSFVLVLILAFSFALPAVVAEHTAPKHDALAIEGEYFVSICANNPNVSISDGEFLEDCLQTGIWQNTNGVTNLQVRAGVTDDGATLKAYSADTRLLP